MPREVSAAGPRWSWSSLARLAGHSEGTLQSTAGHESIGAAGVQNSLPTGKGDQGCEVSRAYREAARLAPTKSRQSLKAQTLRYAHFLVTRRGRAYNSQRGAGNARQENHKNPQNRGLVSRRRKLIKMAQRKEGKPSTTLYLRKLEPHVLARARCDFLGEGPFRAVLKAAFIKCFELARYSSRLKMEQADEMSFFIASAVRGVCEDLIALKFLRQLRRKERDEVISIEIMLATRKAADAQAKFFTKVRPFQPILRLKKIRVRRRPVKTGSPPLAKPRAYGTQRGSSHQLSRWRTRWRCGRSTITFTGSRQTLCTSARASC